MNWPQLLVLIRHGESEANTRSLDDISFEDKPNHACALTEKGVKQAKAAADYLRANYADFDTCFCSTFTRTQETLQLIYPEARPIIDSRLNELWRGIWHTMSKEKIGLLYSEEAAIKAREGEYHYRPLGGQSCQDLELMVYSFIHSLRADYSGKKVLVSAHGNWMLLFWRIMLNRQPQEFINRYKTDKYKNCALAVYENIAGNMRLTVDNIIADLNATR